MCEGNKVSVPDKNFQENPSNAIQDSGENIHWSSCKVPLLTDWSKLTTCVKGITVSVPDKNYQENPFNGIHNSGENMLNNLFFIWPKTTPENDIIAWNFFLLCCENNEQDYCN